MRTETLHVPVLRTILGSINFYGRMFFVLVWTFALLLVMTPLAVLFWGNTTVSWIFARSLSFVTLGILGIRVRILGRENIPSEPAIFMANHQSNFDLLTTGWVYPRHSVVIGKKELARIPLFGTFFAATGNVLLDRSDHSRAIGGMQGAVDALTVRKKNIWIFPEGTRSFGKGLGRFKKGGFHMAIAAGVPIVPIISSPLDDVVDVSNRRILGGEVTMRILPPIPTAGLTEEEVDALRERVEKVFRSAMQVTN